MFTGLGGERLWLCPSLNDSANDISGNGNDGTYQNGMGTISDVSNGGSLAYDLAVNTDRIEIAGIGSSWRSSGTWTISMWLKGMLAQNNQALVLNGNVNLYRGSASGETLQSQQLNPYAGTGYTATGVATGTWYHIVCTSDGTNMKMYADGVEFKSITAGLATTNTGGMTLGSTAGASPNGTPIARLDDIRAYNRALTQSEITHLASYRGVQGSPYYKPLTLKSRVTRLLSNRPTTLLERIRSASKPTTPISIKVKHNEEPSYKAGYAKNAGESENPHLWKGLVGAWMPSLGVTGDTLRDVSGNGNDGTLTNMDAASDWVSTSKGLALDFDGTAGSTDHIVTQTIEHGVIYGDFTWSIWFYPTTSRPSGSTINGICAIGEYSPVFGWSPNGFNDQLGYYWEGWKGFGIWPSLNSWNHGVMTRKNGVITGYLDGKIGSASYLKTSAMNNDRLVIGRSGVDYAPDPFGGRLTNFIFHNRALSPQEIQELYIDSLAPFRRKKSAIGYQPNKELKGLIRTQEKI